VDLALGETVVGDEFAEPVAVRVVGGSIVSPSGVVRRMEDKFTAKVPRGGVNTWVLAMAKFPPVRKMVARYGKRWELNEQIRKHLSKALFQRNLLKCVSCPYPLFQLSYIGEFRGYRR
jgi:hypothetical protein